MRRSDLGFPNSVEIGGGRCSGSTAGGDNSADTAVDTEISRPRFPTVSSDGGDIDAVCLAAPAEEADRLPPVE